MNTMLIEDADEQMLIQWTHDSTSLGEDFVPKDWDENLSHQPDEKDWMKYRWQVEDDYLPGHHNMVEPPTYFDEGRLWSHNRIELDGLTTTAGLILTEALLEDEGEWGMRWHEFALESDVEGCASPAFKNPEHRDHDHWKKCEALRKERIRERIQNGYATS